MGYRYCVFGAGRQGVAAIYDLVINCNADKVLVYDPNLAAILDAQTKLKQLLGDKYTMISWTSAIAEDDTTVNILDVGEDWDCFDVLLSCAPWKSNIALTHFATRIGVPFCDLGGNPSTVEKQNRLPTKTAIVPECGLSPGISNILAVYLAKRGCDEIRVRCGGLPIDRFNDGLNYQITFDPMGLISEYSGDVSIIVAGRVTRIPALSVIETFAECYECSPTSNNSPQVVESLRRLGVLDYDYMTIRYDGHWDLVLGWQAAGFLCGDEKMDLQLAEALNNNPNLQHNTLFDKDKVLLLVRGKRGPRSLREIEGFNFTVLSDPKTKFSAMELMTSWGITMVAHYMAANPGDTPKGFSTPERFIPGDYILSELRKRLPV